MRKIELDLSGRVPELDGIRGIAIGMVLVGHFFMIVSRPGSLLAYALVPLRLMWSGVDLFFVLSGFLIGGILLDARDSSNYFRVFYTRRFFRIVPIYAVLLFTVGLAMYLSSAGANGKYEEIFAGAAAVVVLRYVSAKYWYVTTQCVGHVSAWGDVVTGGGGAVLPNAAVVDSFPGPTRAYRFHGVCHHQLATTPYFLHSSGSRKVRTFSTSSSLACFLDGLRSFTPGTMWGFRSSSCLLRSLFVDGRGFILRNRW